MKLPTKLQRAVSTAWPLTLAVMILLTPFQVIATARRKHK